jgi:hypothetical protein
MVEEHACCLLQHDGLLPTYYSDAVQGRFGQLLTVIASFSFTGGVTGTMRLLVPEALGKHLYLGLEPRHMPLKQLPIRMSRLLLFVSVLH